MQDFISSTYNTIQAHVLHVAFHVVLYILILDKPYIHMKLLHPWDQHLFSLEFYTYI